MASFFGTMAQGVGKGLMQAGNTIHQGNVAALRQKSVEQRWAQQDKMQDERMATQQKRYEESAQTQQKQYNQTMEANENHRADMKLDKKSQAFNREVSSILEEANKQKAAIQKRIDEGDLIPRADQSSEDFLAEYNSGIDDATEARLKTVSNSASPSVVKNSFYSNMFHKPQNKENGSTRVYPSSGDTPADGSQVTNYADLLAQANTPAEGGTDASQDTSLSNLMTMSEDDQSTASNILAAMSQGLMPKDMSAYEQKFLKENSFRMKGLNEARQQGAASRGQGSPSSQLASSFKPSVVDDSPMSAKFGSATNSILRAIGVNPPRDKDGGLMARPAQVMPESGDGMAQPSKGEISAFRRVKNKTKGVDAFLNAALQDGAFRDASDEQIESLIAQIKDADSDASRNSLIQSFANRQI